MKERQELLALREAIKARHSVRAYTGQPIEDDLVFKLNDLIEKANEASGLNMQLILDDPECFDTLITHYGWFKNVNDYIAIVADKDLDDAEEKAGYFGQKIVIEAQMMGLNTCWVGGTYSKGKCHVDMDSGEKILCVIAIGYGAEEGKKPAITAGKGAFTKIDLGIVKYSFEAASGRKGLFF